MHYTARRELIETFSVFVGPDIEDEKIDLIRAALVIARTEYPHLKSRTTPGRIEELARRVAASGSDLRARVLWPLSIAFCSMRQSCGATARTTTIRAILF